MILAIDPGNTESGYALIDPDTCRPVEVGKIPNDQLLRHLRFWLTQDHPVIRVVIEMVASYGMPVGADVFETCVWIGRFAQIAESFGSFGTPCDLVYRKNVKLHLCGTSKAKDANITQALIDRFASGQPNRGKGTKGVPGWFFGFRADIWQAYALAVFVADTIAARGQVAS
jgi:hypothetical protein